MDPTQEITPAVLAQIIERMQLREDVPPQLMYRAIWWAAKRVNDLSNQIARAQQVLAAEPETDI